MSSIGLLVLAAAGALQPREEPTDVLFIGNSYTAQVRGAFNALLAHEKKSIHVEYITPGGRTLAQHLAEPKTVGKIRSRAWSAVVLQEQSQTPAYPGPRKRFYEAATGLHEIIKATGARTVFYMTWGRKDGDKRNPKLAPDYATMQNLLTEAYEEIAQRLGAEVAPVGRIWREVRTADAELGGGLYKKDGSHPSAKGAYIAAVALYCRLFGTAPDAVTFSKGVGPDEGALIRRLASKVFARDRKR